MKKALVLMLALCLCFSVFAGGSKESSGSGKTEINLWHTEGAGASLDALTEIVNNYNATNTKNVHVNLVYAASQSTGNTQTMTNLMAAIGSGNPPDIAFLDGFSVASWAAQGALQPLDEYMEAAGLTFDGVYDWAQEGAIYKGVTYGVPYNGDARALLYNKDMFRAAGLDPDNPPATVEEATEMSKQLLVRDGSNFKQVGLIPWIYAGQPIYTWGWSFGGDFYDAENNVLTVATPENIASLQWEVDFANEMGGQDFVNWSIGLGKGAEDPFVTGQCAMCVRGQFHLVDIDRYAPDMDYGVAPIPSLVEGENITWCGGWCFTIPTGAKNQEASVDFMKYALSEESQELMASKTGSLSPLKTANEKVFAGNEKFKVFIDLLPEAHVRPSVPVGQQLWDEFNTVLEAALYGRDTAENLMKDLDTRINAELQKFN